MKKDGLAKTQENFNTNFTEYYFELNEDNELRKNHIGFVADYNTYQIHVEETHMFNSLNNLTNTVT